MAAAPNGGILLFGGEAVTSGVVLGDTKKMVTVGGAKTWLTPATASSPGARFDHALAGTSTSTGLPLFVLFGGRVNTPTGSVVSQDTFTYDGGSWTKLTGGSAPSARTGHAMVTDPVSQRVLLFGGRSGSVPRNDLWDFNPANGTWTNLIPPLQPGSPSPRFDHCMTFDPLRGKALLFGGSGFLSDTWEYSPATNTWVQLSFSGPTGRTKAAMSYHGTQDRIVLFGGQNAAVQPLGDTWILHPTLGWSQASPSTSPLPRFDHAMSEDDNGDQVVMVGGDDGTGQKLSQTWTWNGINWSENLPPPAPRSGVGLTFDSARGRHVVFGGRSQASGADLSETWELDGLNWRQRNLPPNGLPSARADAAIAYHPGLGRTVLYGGRQGGACGLELGDTWEWSGSQWIQRNNLPQNPPVMGGGQMVYDPNRNRIWMLVGSEMWSYDGVTWQSHAGNRRPYSAAAYDSTRNRLVVYGGSPLSNNLFEWSESTGWTKFSAAPIWPPGTQEHQMVFHESRQQTLLIGGFTSGGSPGPNLQTWGWNGASWLPLPPSLPGNAFPAIGYDANRQTVVMHGGYINSGPGPQPSLTAETKELGPSGPWTTVSPAPIPSPSSRYHASMTSSVAGNGMVMFGGIDSVSINSRLADTWNYDGTSWVQVATSGPSARDSSAMGSNPTHTVLFGGMTQGEVRSGETWIWNGTTWTQLFPANQPTPRAGATMFRIGSRLLMFGGWTDQGLTDEIWEWKIDPQTSAWNWFAINTPPPARTNYAMSYDTRNGQVVIFGGRSSCSGNLMDDTYTFDGANWKRQSTPLKPTPRDRAAMAYDRARSRLVLHGGQGTSSTLGDTWEWDGSQWLLRNVAYVPPAASGHGMAYDLGRKLPIAFGTFGTWDYSSTKPGTVEELRPSAPGCAGSRGAINAMPTEWAGPWLGEPFGLSITYSLQGIPPVAPLGIPVVVFGFTDILIFPNVILGMPQSSAIGCTLDVSPDVFEVAQTPWSYTSFAMPSSPSVVGISIFCQAAFFDFGLAGVPVATSNSIKITIGAK